MTQSAYNSGWNNHLIRIDQLPPTASYSYSPTEYKVGNDYYTGTSFIFRCDKPNLPLDNNSGAVVQWGTNAATSAGLTRPDGGYIIKFDTSGNTGSVATSYTCKDVLGNSATMNNTFNIIALPVVDPPDSPGNISNNPGSRTCNFVKTSDGRIVRSYSASGCKESGYDNGKYVDADEEGGIPRYGCKSWNSKKDNVSKPNIISTMAGPNLLQYLGNYYRPGSKIGDTYVNGYKCTEFYNYGEARTNQSPPGEVYHIGCCNY